jgi:hypothetical protein
MMLRLRRNQLRKRGRKLTVNRNENVSGQAGAQDHPSLQRG